jgi:hypothetical protein
VQLGVQSPSPGRDDVGAAALAQEAEQRLLVGSFAKIRAENPLFVILAIIQMIG